MEDEAPVYLPAVDTEQVGNSIIVSKVKERISQSKPADILSLDVDGTVYTLVPDAEGNLIKTGDNSQTSTQVKEKSIPIIINSGRPDWKEENDQEMASLGLVAPDVVSVAGGSLIYWREKDGRLLLDQNWLRLMNEQKISLPRKIMDKKKLLRLHITQIAYKLTCVPSLVNFHQKRYVLIQIVDLAT